MRGSANSRARSELSKLGFKADVRGKARGGVVRLIHCQFRMSNFIQFQKDTWIKACITGRFWLPANGAPSCSCTKTPAGPHPPGSFSRGPASDTRWTLRLAVMKVRLREQQNRITLFARVISA
jgi:hypothetical protein